MTAILLSNPAVDGPPSIAKTPEIAVVSDAQDVPSVPACLPVHRGTDTIGFALVDRELLPRLRRRRWNLDPQGYAYTTTGDGRVALHRYVLGLRVGEPFVVHHRNAEKLDCRRANLQLLTREGHAIAHGMRPRSAAPIITADDDRRAHPAYLRGIAGWLEKIRGLGDDEVNARGGRPKKLPRVLSQDEVTALMRMPNLKCPTGLRDRAMMALMHRCGLRVSEACGLHLRDVKWADHQIHLRPEITKGGVEAVVYLDGSTQDLLERWVAVRRQYAAGKPWLFVCVRSSHRGEPLERRRVWEMIRRRARRAGIEGPVSPHMLRHTYATELLREGFNLREVQHLMRHADVRTTVIYTHLFEADLAAKIARR